MNASRLTPHASRPEDFGKVAVLMGGWSSERQVALWSGEAVHQALVERGVDAHAVDLTRERLFGLKAEGFDRAFNVLHGTGGEDGTVQAVLDLLGVPYTGSGVLASALAMDKLRTKRIWKSEGLPTPEWLVLRSNEDALAAGTQLGFPYFVKPAAEGSSVGISKVKFATSAVSAYRKAAGEYEDRPRVVLAERMITGGEYTCAILDGQALPTIRIEPDGEFYDYNAKYISNDTRYHCPSGLPAALEAEIQALSLRAFELLGASGWGRVDFLLDEQQRPWLLEANLVPGMTSHSLVPMAAKAVGLSFADLCWRILQTTLSSEGTI
ncbi:MULTISPECIES: D-alanine--D-alanine ligase [Hydrocarboniphaga]|uniref:D-alanine--D-alanine ligase n=1 Tax=Hydrocarboniphaga effusa AP103 TaxID=1172194 RepID=I8T5H3_9GAMM|nr:MULTISPECIES: D-alanine--D-alanine ligase [Hydrocarboniphaga]EIT69175.1 D-alanine-D-alanine ligase B [Hydrocarboniphaga effusa AP103]MDZ4081037.1 D-alanine--D-alanine ligase [Hydrocarboniphaga sp.]